MQSRASVASQVRNRFRALLLTLAVSSGVALLADSAAPHAMAQAVSNAKMHGVITDASGGVIPNATVLATQTESGQTATATTSSTGSYLFPNLPVGLYTLKVTAPGFQTYSQNGILLQVSNDAEINAPLTVGATDQVINVEAGGTQLQTEDTAITTIVDRARTVDLPLNGRNAANLVLLSGGAAATPTGNTVSSKTYGSVGVNAIGGSVSISVAGGQGSQVNFLLDGGDNNDPAYNTNLPFPFPDALQEFSVQTTGLAAQYGLHPGGTVNIVTKSGTNQIHGGVFEFLRNDYTNAANRIAGKVTPLKRNQYGGLLGGPVRRDKLFLFGGYQGTALRISNPSAAVIPTSAAASGNWTPYFQALRANSPTGACPLTPARVAVLVSAGFNAATTSAANCTATINPSLYSQTALNVDKLLPTATTTDSIGDVSFNVPYPQSENQWIGRVDAVISPRQNVFARYFMANYGATAEFGGNLLNTANAGLIDRNKTLTLGHNFTLTPQLTNALRLTGNRLAVQRGPSPDLPNLAQLGSNITTPLAHSLYLNVAGNFFVACGQCPPYVKVTNQLQAADDLSFVKGKHFLQGGFDYIGQQYNQHFFNNEDGQFVFTGGYSGFAQIDFLLGAPTSLQQANGGAATLEHFQQNYFGYYLQDTFRARQNLVLTYGLRWEPWFPAYNKDSRGQTFSQANFNAGIQSQVFPNAPSGLLFIGDKGVGRSIVTAKLGSVSPRFGFTFDPGGKGRQSLRGSYTLLFDEPSVVQTTQFFDSGVPYGGTQNFTFNNATFKRNLDNPYQGIAGGNPFPSVYPPTSTVAFPLSGISPQVDPADLRRPYANQYNLSYQIQVSSKWLLTASYLGTHTIHLLGNFPLNYATYYPGISHGNAGDCGGLNPLPAAGTACSTTSNNTQRLKLYQQSGGPGTAGSRYSAFSEVSNYGMANYNGVIVTANHQVANNFTVLANYTYSKCLGNLNFSGDASEGPQDPNNLAAEYGPCNFDLKHNFTLSGVVTSPKLGNPLLNLLAGGFQVSPLFTYHTGTPFTVGPGTDVSLTGLGSDRANVVPGVPVYNHNFYTASLPNNPQWFNPAAFSPAALGTFGNSRPFSLRGPGFANLDVAVSKFIPVYERAKLELRGEAFNALNHPNYNNPVGISQIVPQVATLNSPTAGRITSTSTDARTLQIAAKIIF